MERTPKTYVFQNIRETKVMNRSVALRTFAIFTAITAFAILAGVSSNAAIAEAIFAIGGLLALIMLAFVAALPRSQPVPIPVRVKSRR